MTIKLLYLASTPFTGSTLVSILLGSHPDIATISELTGVVSSVDAKVYRCSCGASLVDCKFFDEVARKLRASGLELNFQNFRTTYRRGSSLKQKALYNLLPNSFLEKARDSIRGLLPGCRKHVAECDAFNSALIRAVSEVTGRATFLDASKDPHRIPFLARMHKGPMAILHVTRDVRAYANSFRKNSSGDVNIAAKDWVRTHRNIMRVSGSVRASYGFFRYEDICRNTEKTIREIYKYAGLQEDVDIVFSPRLLHLIGNRMRLQSDVKIRLDESWRDELSVKEQAVALQIGGNLMQKFGYI